MSGSETNQYSNQLVVLVPGMLSPRLTMWPMARRFNQHGFQTIIFSNRYLSNTPAQNAQRLLLTLDQQKADQVHLVGHSLGGIVIMHALKLNSERVGTDRFADGRVVLIASPVQGSEFARRLHRIPFVRWIMSRCAADGVLNGMVEELDGRKTGVISGSSRGGVAALFYKPEHTNDGLINEFETRLECAHDTISVPQSHGLMLFSRQCSDSAAQFLQHGQFFAKC